MIMSDRLQILVNEEEAQLFRRCARSSGETLSQWARQAMRLYLERQRARTRTQKLQTLERALRCSYPTADIDPMLAEIEAGRDLR